MGNLLLHVIVLTTSAAAAPLGDVESTYWDCESATEQAILELGEAAACSEAFEFLKQHKFEGDFQKFLVWWKKNKHRELSKRRQLVQPPIYD